MLTVVTGPPCVGKSTYIEQRARHGDIIIDLDRIALALTTDDTGHHDYDDTVRYVARQARLAAIDAAVQVQDRDVWVIDAAPSRQQRAWYHRQRAHFADLTEQPDVLAARAAQRPARNRALIERLDA